MANAAAQAGTSRILAARFQGRDFVATYKRPPLYRLQREAIFGPHRYGWIEASTKSGKTHGCLVWLLEQALRGKPGDNYWWVAPSHGQAKIAFTRMKRGLVARAVGHSANEGVEIPYTTGAGMGIYTIHLSERRLTLANGAIIWFKSGEIPDTLYGEDVKAVVIDEASRLREASYHAVRSTLTATQGPIRLIGNVKGRGNWFYKGCRKAKAGLPGHAYFVITAWDAVKAGVLAEAEILDAKAALPPHVFSELYECVASDDGWNPFGLSAIEALIVPVLSNAAVAAWGWDLAKSVDWTVGVGLDIRGYMARLERFQKPWNETITTIRDATGRVQALVDSTGVGDPVLEALQRPRAHTVDKAGGRAYLERVGHFAGNFEGFHFSGPSKQELMEDLALGISQQHIRIVEGVVADELREFEYQHTRTGVRYAAPAGCHDDAVMALALSYRRLKNRKTPARIL